MQTELNYKAYLAGFLFMFIPIFAWIGVAQVGASLDNQMISLLAFIHFLCWGNFIYNLFTEYWQYECNNENLIIKNLITKSQKIIPLQNISNIELTRHQLKNGHYHNIKLILRNDFFVLRGIYIENIESFFNFLKQKI